MPAAAPGQPASTDAQLIDAARRGAKSAFAELYERYGGRVHAYVLGMVRDENRAEDITQDVFLSALRRIRESDCAIAFKPWIYKIARNACVDEFRRLKRSKEVPIDHDGCDERLTSPTPPPNTRFEQGQQFATLHAAFRGLSERQHTVIVLRELEGLPYTEIARRTGMTLPMVESTLWRARRRLGEEYEDIASGRRCAQVHEIVDAGGQLAVKRLGLRERRRFGRHIAHCQPCARYAQTAGIVEDEKRVPLAKRLAGLLPAPFIRSMPGGSHRQGSGNPRLRQAFDSARRVAHFASSGAPAGIGPATAATIAAAVIAGGGVATELLSHSQARANEPGIGSAAATAAVRSSAIRARPTSTHARNQRTASSTSGSGSTRRTPDASATGSARSGASASRRRGISTATPTSSAGRGSGATSSTGSGPLASLPSTRSLPSGPSVRPVQHLPSASRLPSLPKTAVPRLPSTRHLLRPPKLPGLPKLPAVPKLPALPKVPAVPKTPSAPEVVSPHKVVAVPQVPPAPKLPPVPNVPPGPKIG